jgi:hypothetical protein
VEGQVSPAHWEKGLNQLKTHAKVRLDEGSKLVVDHEDGVLADTREPALEGDPNEAVVWSGAWQYQSGTPKGPKPRLAPHPLHLSLQSSSAKVGRPRWLVRRGPHSRISSASVRALHESEATKRTLRVADRELIRQQPKFDVAPLHVTI